MALENQLNCMKSISELKLTYCLFKLILPPGNFNLSEFETLIQVFHFENVAENFQTISKLACYIGLIQESQVTRKVAG